MEITIRRADGTSCVMTPDIKKLIVVGFSGCDKEKTMEHIHELEKAGVKCPEDVPVVYECDPQINYTETGNIRGWRQNKTERPNTWFLSRTGKPISASAATTRTEIWKQ